MFKSAKLDTRLLPDHNKGCFQKLCKYYIYMGLNISQERQRNLPKLCSDCRLATAKKTMNLQEAIDILGDVGTEFTSYLCDNIITQNARQEINNAKHDGQALSFIRKVSVWFCM